MHTCTHADRHTDIAHIHAHTYIHAHMHTLHTCTHTHMHTLHTCTHTHTLHTSTHARTHTHTHKHARTCPTGSPRQWAPASCGWTPRSSPPPAPARPGACEGHSGSSPEAASHHTSRWGRRGRWGHVRGTLAAVQKQLRTTLEVRQAGQVRAGEGHSGSSQASAWQQSGGAGGRGVSE